MPAPTNVPEWNSGGTNRTEPPGGVKVSGFTVNGAVSSSFLNWILFTIYEWILYLQNLTAEALTWTALQTFSGRLVSNTATTSPAILGNNTGAAAADSAGVKGTSINGPGVLGNAKVGVYGTHDGTGGGLTSAGVRGDSNIPTVPGVRAENQQAGGLALIAEVLAADGNAIRGTAATGAGIGVSGTGGLYGVEGSSAAGTSGTAAVRGRGGFSGGDFAPTAGSNGRGVTALGNGTGPGVFATGGGNGGAGVQCAGGAGNGPGGRFSGNGAGQGLVAIGGNAGGVGGEFGRGDSLSNAPAVECVGAISFAAASPPAGNANVSRQFHAKQSARAWGLLTLNNTAAPTIVDRIGVNTVAQNMAGNGVITVTLAQPMASGAYGVAAFCFANLSNARVTRARSINATQLEIEIYDPSAPAAPLTAAATNNFGVFFFVMGEQ